MERIPSEGAGGSYARELGIEGIGERIGPRNVSPYSY
jgi:hypothetical protein